MRRRASAVLLILGFVTPRLGAGAGSAQELRISVEQPAAGAAVADGEGSVFVAGRALGLARRAERFEIVLALDLSRSAAAASGVDVDGDGLLGTEAAGRFSDRTSSDPGDSVLAAEVEAARTLLAQLDPATTRLALVTFAGDSKPGSAAARLRVGLTSDFAVLERELARVREETPRGRTHISAALELAGAELLSDRADAKATRIVLLMSDGEPTLPFPLEPEANARHALAVARRLGDAGIRVDSFATAVPSEATQRAAGTQVATALAAATGGEFRTVPDPAQLVASFERLRAASLERLEVYNRTTGKAALAESVERDGRFTAVVLLAAGENWLSIRARGSDGSSAERTLRVMRVADASAVPLQPRWVEPRRRLLENRLDRLRRRRMALEAEQASLELQDRLRDMHRVRNRPVRSLSVRPERVRPQADRRAFEVRPSDERGGSENHGPESRDRAAESLQTATQ